MPSIDKLKPKKVKGRIKVFKALPYKGSMVYLRMIDDDIFEYLVVFKGEIYSNYIIMTPKKGEKKLSEDEISQSAGLVMAGAATTIETLLGEKLDPKKAEVVKAFESSRKSVERIKSN